MEPEASHLLLLVHQPWLPADIGGRRLLTKSWFGETEYQILLTDLQCVWQESMDTAAIQRRAQELNRRLRAPVGAFFSHLREVVGPCLSGSEGAAASGQAQISLVHQEDGGRISIKLKSELAGLPFYWDFHCTPAPITVVCAHLVRPLLAMSHLLQRQTEQLGDLLVRKDAEILDYKENGATLTRERLQTDVFEEHAYREEFMAKVLPGLCSGQPDTLNFDGDLQQLYAAVVVAQGNAQTRKRKLSEQEDEQQGEESVAAVASTPGESAGGQTTTAAAGERRQVDVGGAKAADGPAVRQPVASQRPASKPKKKKVVGLFR